MNLVVIGPSGSGKGTQIDRLVGAFGLVHFSPGNLFREHAKRRTALGLLAQKYFNRGDLVPDEVVEAMLEEWVWLTDPGQDIVFDGFPRTRDQAFFLERVFKEVGRTLGAVIALDASEETVLKRLAGRRACSVCGDEFHDVSAPFQKCPYEKCQGEHLKRLEDDKTEVIRARLKVFHGAIEPLLEHYQQAGNLIRVDSEPPVEEVHATIIRGLEALKN